MCMCVLTGTPVSNRTSPSILRSVTEVRVLVGSEPLLGRPVGSLWLSGSVLH